MMLGSAGNFDFAAEQHRPITADELNASITGAIGGIITLVIGAILGATCDNINKTIDSELERRRKIAIEKRKARARQQMEINEELNRDYAAFLESYKTVS
ncbi:hypothetical protein J6A31_04870 [bacterium]|nr:hypothetical protein [bacterium]